MAAEKDTVNKGIRDGQPKSMKQVTIQHLEKAGHFGIRWQYRVPPEISPADLLVSDFWRGVHKNFRAGSIVECLANDRFFAELLIQDCGAAHCVMFPLRVVELTPAHQPEADLPEGYSISFVGPDLLWGVFRGSERVQSGFANKTAAREWLTMPGRVASQA